MSARFVIRKSEIDGEYVFCKVISSTYKPVYGRYPAQIDNHLQKSYFAKHNGSAVSLIHIRNNTFCMPKECVGKRYEIIIREKRKTSYD